LEQLKEFFTVYPEGIDNFHLWGAIFSFIIFVIYILSHKIISTKDSDSQVARLHYYFFLPYLLISFLYCALTGRIDSYPIGSLLSGAFIYFSLYYVYLSTLIKMSKKSISLEILGHIRNVSPEEECTQKKLLLQFLQGKRGAEYMRDNGIKQLVKKGWMKEKGSVYSITSEGKKINELVCSLIKLFDLRRY